MDVQLPNWEYLLCILCLPQTKTRNVVRKTPFNAYDMEVVWIMKNMSSKLNSSLNASERIVKM